VVRSRRGSQRASGVLIPLLLSAGAPALGAQQPMASSPPVIRWWHGAAALAGIALVSVGDEWVQRTTQESRSPARDQVAAVARRMGQPEVFATVPAALFIAGIGTRRPALRRAGERVAASLVLAGLLAVTSKVAVGRLRPNQAAEPYDLRPFSGADAFPSGHTTMAFALATALADEIHRPWASVGLLAAAAGTGWSRLNDNKHWLSDVVAGAVLGITSAQVIEGRWRIFHLRPPVPWVSRGRAGVGWRIPLGTR
jgi:membrane-associated phospholipid phosphatase